MSRLTQTLPVFAIAAVAVASALFTGAARAESPTIDTASAPAFSATKTRAQVNAELMQARADGSIRVWSTSYNPLTAAKSLKSRDEVRAQMFAARASGELGATTGEDSGAAWFAKHERLVPAVATRVAQQGR